MKNNILFIYAHLDDETILSYGTMLKLVNDYNINILILCGNGSYYRFFKSINQFKRIKAFKINCKDFKFKLCNYNNLTLTREIVKNEVEKYIFKLKPEKVFTHSTTDIHYEHRLIADEVITACRAIPNSSIKALYCTEQQTARWAYNQFGVFQANYFIDISNYISLKRKALMNYNCELPAFNNDLRSVDSIIDYNQLLGRQVGTDYCEAYQQIFSVI